MDSLTLESANSANNVNSELSLRTSVLYIALSGGAKFDNKTIPNAEAIYKFITAGNVDAPSAKPATNGAKSKSDDAPSTKSPATEPSSDKPAEKATPTATATSPSDGASGFDNSGDEITPDQFREACIKFVNDKGATGQDELRGIFAKFGFAGVSKVAADKYGEVLALMNAAAVPTSNDDDELFG